MDTNMCIFSVTIAYFISFNISSEYITTLTGMLLETLGTFKRFAF